MASICQYTICLAICLLLSRQFSVGQTVDSPIDERDCLFPMECALDTNYYNGECVCTDCAPFVQQMSCFLAPAPGGQPLAQLRLECRKLFELGYCNWTMRYFRPASTQRLSTTTFTTIDSVATVKESETNSAWTIVVVSVLVAAASCVLLVAVPLIVAVCFCPCGRRWLSRLSRLKVLNRSATGSDDNSQSAMVTRAERADMAVNCDGTCGGPCPTSPPMCPHEADEASVRMLYKHVSSAYAHSWLLGLAHARCDASSSAITPDIPSSSVSNLDLNRRENPAALHLSAPMLHPAAAVLPAHQLKHQLMGFCPP